ncbi:DUF1822 family protein [Leptothermofonsia sp. ETS-13]|uniref:DUF1822 family protein n=1 Tax=Leptothermofonsia sp. ETS-13 TaxID=3035696 RepID=UPI003BA1B54B
MLNSLDFLTEMELLPEEAIALEPNHLMQAANLSSQVNPERQWQVYLNALALFSFEQWLKRRSGVFSLNYQNCSLMHSSYAEAIPAVCNVEVNQFKLCLLAVGDWDETVTIPAAAIDLPEFVAHFYVVLEVHEEQQQVIIQGVLRYDQLMRYQQAQPIQADAEQNYVIPYTWFEADPDSLLLYLRCLEPAAISLPTVASNQLPDLTHWLQFITQPAVNASLWLREQWDEVAQEFAWILLPPPAAASALRSPITDSFQRSPGEEFEAIVQQLERNGLRLPTQARGAYRDWIMANIPLRLYAVVGDLPPVEGIPEWSLLLVLGAQPGANLPQGISLEVSDPTGVLVQRTLDTQTNADYLFTQVAGTWDEKFLVRITLPDGERLTLPPFTFQPN